MAKSTREAFWFVKGFDGLIKEVSPTPPPHSSPPPIIILTRSPTGSDRRQEEEAREQSRFGPSCGGENNPPKFTRSLPVTHISTLQLTLPQLWDDDDEEINSVVEDSDLQEILNDVELVGEVRLKRGKTLSNKQLVQIQETFETRQGAASILQKIVRKMVGALGSEQLDFSPEEVRAPFARIQSRTSLRV